MLASNSNEILTVAAKLPAAPQVLAELSELLEDPNADIPDIARLVRRDGPLATGILRISNSVYYGAGGIGSIEEAVSRIGFSEIHRVVGCAATSLIADRALTYYRIGAESLREHMVCTGIACEFLAGRTVFKPHHAYTAGLLKPLGMMVLDRMCRTAKTPVPPFEQERHGSYSEWEAKVMPVGNPEATALILKESRFASDVVEAVRTQFFKPDEPGATQGGALLHLAGWVVAQVGPGLPGEAHRWTLNPERFELAGVSEDHVDSCVDQVAANFNAVRLALG